MTRYAVISDVHANFEALTAVVRDIDAQGIGEIRCLGDVVGYGPNPVEVADMIRERCRFTLKGNHDEALEDGGYGFSARALSAIQWTRQQLEPSSKSGPQARRRWQLLLNLPLQFEEAGDLFVHGSPRDPTNEYILPSDVGFDANRKLSEIFAAFGRRLFVGHSHIPCVITDLYEVQRPPELGYSYTIPRPEEGAETKAIINVGSVGQPRDHDPRACYVVVEGPTVTWRRVEYDRRATIAKMERIDQLHPTLRERLLVGT